MTRGVKGRPCPDRRASPPAAAVVPSIPPVEDMLAHLGHAVEPFLPTLTAIALRLFTTATAAIPAGATPAPAAAGGSSQDAAGAGDGPEEASQGKQKEQGAEGAEDEEEGEEEEGGKEVPALERHREVRGSALRLFAQVSADDGHTYALGQEHQYCMFTPRCVATVTF